MSRSINDYAVNGRKKDETKNTICSQLKARGLS